MFQLKTIKGCGVTMMFLLLATGCASTGAKKKLSPNVAWWLLDGTYLSSTNLPRYPLTPAVSGLTPIQRVEIYIDGQRRGSTYQAPWTWDWPLKQESTGTHRIEGIAFDTEGRRGKATLSVFVVDTTLEISSPGPGESAEAGSTLEVSWYSDRAPLGAHLDIIRLVGPRTSRDLVPMYSAFPVSGMTGVHIPEDVDTSDDYRLLIQLTSNGMSGSPMVLATATLPLSINRPGEKTAWQMRRFSIIKQLQTEQDPQVIHKLITEVGTQGPRARKTMPFLLRFLEDERLVLNNGRHESVAQGTARAFTSIHPDWVAPEARVNALIQRARQPFKVVGGEQQLVYCSDQSRALSELAALGRAAMMAIPFVTPLAGRSCTKPEAVRFFDAVGTPLPETAREVSLQLRDPDPTVRAGAEVYFERHPEAKKALLAP